MKLQTLSTMPPGGWRFKHIGTGFVSTGITFQSLVQKVMQYRQNHGEPIVSEGYARLSDEVEEEICQSLSIEDQGNYCNTKWRPMTGVHWREVARFLHTVASWITTGFTLVPQSEAERRAAICVKCPLNVGMTGCAMCRSALKEGREKLMQRSTSSDGSLLACGVCGCDNKTQVHVPLDVLRAGKKGLSFPEWCWQASAE
jgi:hypothetical protein